MISLLGVTFTEQSVFYLKYSYNKEQTEIIFTVEELDVVVTSNGYILDKVWYADPYDWEGSGLFGLKIIAEISKKKNDPYYATCSPPQYFDSKADVEEYKKLAKSFYQEKLDIKNKNRIAKLEKELKLLKKNK